MSKKSAVIILVLSVVVTYGVAMVDGLRRNSFLGDGGIPLRFARGSFLGGSTNYFYLLIDIVLWFIVIWLVWKILQKIIKK